MRPFTDMFTGGCGTVEGCPNIGAGMELMPGRGIGFVGTTGCDARTALNCMGIGIGGAPGF
jgi:hypothetical protein